MPRGGARENSGRKSRVAHAKDRAVQATNAIARKIKLTPLEIITLAMMQAWDKGEVKEAVSYAKEAAPYLHPKLAAVEHSGNADAPLRTITEIRWATPSELNGSNGEVSLSLTSPDDNFSHSTTGANDLPV